MPPFDIVANTNYQDEKRLEAIAKRNTPKPQEVISYDFVTYDAPSKENQYKININNMGYRDLKDRVAEKTENTFRVLAFGTYQTFGFGVDTKDTYPSQLERSLNERFPQKSFEV